MTQYDAVAEIEAMKARRAHGRPSPESGRAAREGAWSSAREREIRAEMERRLAEHRAVRRG